MGGDDVIEGGKQPMLDELPGITPMKWMTPEVSAAFPVVVAASLLRSGLVRSHSEIESLARGLEHHRAILHEDHPRLTRDENNMIALLEAYLLRSLRAFVDESEQDQ